MDTKGDDKTVLDYLHRLPFPYCFQALSNLNNKYATIPAVNGKEALVMAFVWESTPEGWAYWMKVHELYIFETWKLN